MTIDGVASSTEATFDVINPATGAPEATAPDCTPQQLDAAMASSAKAYRDWRRDESRRRDLLRQCADALMGAAEDIAPLLTLEQGRSEEHTSELQSLMRNSYAVFCLKKQKTTHT